MDLGQGLPIVIAPPVKMLRGFRPARQRKFNNNFLYNLKSFLLVTLELDDSTGES